MVAVVFRSSWPFDTMLAKSTSVCLIVSFATLAHSATLATTVSRAPASIVLQVDASQSPSPTEKAVLPNVELLRRSDPGLCGYWNGNAAYPVSCNAGYVFATANAGTEAGCCDPNNLAACVVPQTCISYGGYCTGACSAENLLWTSCGYLAPYCVFKVYEIGSYYTEYDCGTSPAVFNILPYAYGATTTGSNQAATTASPAPAASVIIETGTSAAQVTGSGNTIIITGSNNCGNGSNCGSGNSVGGSGNNVKSGDAHRSVRLSSFVDFSYIVFLVFWAW